MITPELTLLSSVMLDGHAGYDEAAVVVREEDFPLEGQRKLWRMFGRLRDRNHPYSADLVFEELDRVEGMRSEDSAHLVAELYEEVPLAGYTRLYAERVREAARKRRTAKVIELANQRLADGEDEKWVKDELLADMNEIEEQMEARRGPEPLAEIVPKVIEALRDRLLGDESRAGLKTGIAQLDGMTTGLNPHELWIVGGMPGRGKTAWGVQVAHHLVARGVPVYMVSLEMSREEIARRMLRMRFGAVAENPGKRWEEVVAYAKDLETLPLYFYEKPSVDVRDIVKHTRLAIRLHGIRLVVVDHLQLIEAAGRERRDEVSAASNQLRMLAKDTGVPVLALSQLRRPHNLNDRPSMIDLKESGDIEAHAHVVLLLYMPMAEDGGAAGLEEIIIGKQREGPIGTVPVYFKGEYGIFTERTRRTL